VHRAGAARLDAAPVHAERAQPHQEGAAPRG